MAKPRGARYAIEVVMNWENARVIRKAFFPENSQCPETFCCDRIACRTVTENRLTDGILENPLGPPRFCTELLRGLGIEPLMGITMRRHFVSACTDSAYQSGVSFGNPPQNKKGGLRLMRLQDL